jgi:Asp-tRNA(Asn)/Glu-tRNA(Gln) amidotransferase A subunit family amidase
MVHKRTSGIVMTLLALVFSTSAAHAEVFRLEEATIADITAAFNAGALTCRQLTQLYLSRIAAYDKKGPTLNSIITVNPRALETAAALDEERRTRGPRGRLHCIPVLLKDNIDTADMPTTNGSVILKDAIPPDDAYITKALKDAGALILGKAAMGEFAAGSYNTVVGQTINPYNLLRDTGGSSSGSGASIAANFAVLAVGTDTSTSVRGPASFNGIVGIRPTTGLVSRDGIAPKNLNFDSAGPLARTVTDVAMMLTTMAGPDPADPDGLSADVFRKHPAGVGMDYTQFLRRGSLKGARIGVARAYFGGDPEIDALANAAIAKMKELGAEIIDPVIVDPGIVDNVRAIADYRFKDDWEKYLATFGPQVPKTVAEFLQIYKTKVAQSPLPVANNVLDLLERAQKTSTDLPAYKDLLKRVLPANTAMKNAIFDRYNLDALVFPYNPTFATPINNPVYKRADPTFVDSKVPTPSTLATYSSIGSPGIVVPMGFGKQGLPMTISFMGRPYEEGKIIGYAYDYEQATKLRRPSPLVPSLPGETITYELR